MVIKIGEWEIEVDIETTKSYYQNFIVANPNTQCYRNYLEYCKKMSKPEQDFFGHFSIDPKCCNVYTVGLTSDKTYPVYGIYFFAGKFINAPKEEIMLIEELIEKNFVIDTPDPRVYIDNYQFEFMNPEFMSARIPNDIPDGFICIKFYCKKMPWLLNERCKERMYTPPKPWQFIKKAKIKINLQKQRRDLINTTKSKLMQLFDRHGINYKPMRKSELNEHMERWFVEIVPTHNQTAARNNCFSTGNFLWHAFSYGNAPCADGDNAKIEFENHSSGEAILFIQARPKKLGFFLDKTDGITADELNEFHDLFLTHENFDWTYVHTHECYCGPFYYQRGKTFLNLNKYAEEMIWSNNKSAYCEIINIRPSDYMAMFYIQDHDNYSNTYYRSFYLEKRLIGTPKEEVIQKAKSVLNQIELDNAPM